MANCVKCQRVLPPNGRCLFCGDEAYQRMDAESSHASSAFRKMAMRLLNLALVGGFLYGGYWLFLTEPGQAVLDSAMRALKLKSPRQPEGPAQEILAKFPKILPMVQDPAFRIQETKEDEQHFMLTFITYRSGKMDRYMWLVNVETGLVTAQDDASAALIKP